MWLSYVAYLFDLNFPASFVWIRESGYMEKILRRYAPIDPEDKKRWQKISGLTRSYIQENCGLSENLSARLNGCVIFTVHLSIILLHTPHMILTYSCQNIPWNIGF